MNILYCGDKNIIDGLIISILSLLKNTNEELHIYVLTMKYNSEEINTYSLDRSEILRLDKIIKEKRSNSFIKLIDVTDIVIKELPYANMSTRFTPCCMLRLYADKVANLPSKILYLDNDVVALKNPLDFYNIDNRNYHLVGVLDYYGSRFFRRKIYRRDYLNSGVLLLNLDLIREDKVFLKARNRCKKIKMLLPDQTALNIYAKKKLIVDRIYNEQKKESDKTVFRHFTTTFKYWPTVHTQTIKPWHIVNLHNILNVHSFDDILEEYQDILRRIKDDK